MASEPAQRRSQTPDAAAHARGPAGAKFDLPDEVRRERGPVLRRTLRALPGDMLAALERGLGRHGDALLPGRLYRASDGGGCAVGVMLRELEPQAFSGRIRFWVRHGWRRRAGSYGKRLRAGHRLRHLEWTFDAAATEAHRLVPGIDRRTAAIAVGAWIRQEARAELQWRRLAGKVRREGRDALTRAPLQAGGALR